MKKTLVLALCATMALTACGGGASAGDSQAKGDSKQKLVLSTFGLSEDISTEEVYAPFEQEFNCEILTETGGANDRYTKLSADSETSIDVIELSQACLLYTSIMTLWFCIPMMCTAGWTTTSVMPGWRSTNRRCSSRRPM